MTSAVLPAPSEGVWWPSGAKSLWHTSPQCSESCSEGRRSSTGFGPPRGGAKRHPLAVLSEHPVLEPVHVHVRWHGKKDRKRSREIGNGRDKDGTGGSGSYDVVVERGGC